MARAVLPGPDDLGGTGWTVDADDADGDPAHGGSPASPFAGDVPDGFPEDAVLADAAVSLVHDGPVLVHVVAAVFGHRPDAATAWGLLADPAFVERFLAGLADDEGDEGDREVLGPVTAVPSFAVDRAGWRSAQHHAAWSVADGDALLPIGVEMAVLLAGTVVVVAWLAGPSGSGADAAWGRLLERLERRCEAALGAA
ncbi:MAG: hypothetical protein U0Q07_19125 [Acidimicrobiales bacterium]